jgi:hypothetical protein
MPRIESTLVDDFLEFDLPGGYRPFKPKKQSRQVNGAGYAEHLRWIWNEILFYPSPFVFCHPCHTSNSIGAFKAG